MNSAFRLLLIPPFSFALTTLAGAHAFLDHAEPRVGSTVETPPAQVKVFMTEDLEGAFSKLQVFTKTGTEVDKKDAKVSGATMTVSLPKLEPGTYHVAWKALSTDTHRTQGSFDFTVQ